MSNLTFNFKLAAVVKKKRTTSNSSVPSHVKKLIGVVRIDENAHYYVRVYKSLNECQDYEISPSFITCKGKEVVWKFDKKSTRVIQWIRNPNNLCPLTYHWKPFKPGSIVKGYIDSLGQFNIIKVKYSYIEDYDKEDIVEKDNILCMNDVFDAMKFYVDNRKTIIEAYELKYGRTE